MIWIFLSPDFPPNYHLFSWHFREQGGISAGISGTAPHLLPPHVKQSLVWYESVPDLHDTDAVIAAAQRIQERFGTPNGVDSFNEYWLPLEALIREKLKIPGPKPENLPDFQQKSRMKAFFEKAGIEPIPGRVAQSFSDVEAFIEAYDFPIIAKPDKGVGASATFKIASRQDLAHFQASFRPGYLLEKFITGTIQTYDGLVDREGRIVFAASLEYSRGVAEVVSADTDIFYWVQREIPSDLAEIGPRIVAAYGLRAQFFHFEFIRSSEDGKVYPLEVNMRPPGYPTLDLFNFAHDIDLYRLWAEVVWGRSIEPISGAKYYSCYIARKPHIGYMHTHEEVLRRLEHRLLYHAPTNPLFRRAMGDYHYVIRTPDKEEMLELAYFAQKRLTL
ncbi:MAG: carboxylate--amine ligase [Bacteroidia bacterium]|nr:carboxylate--amine ligase [Bacteroidia bacterium]